VLAVCGPAQADVDELPVVGDTTPQPMLGLPRPVAATLGAAAVVVVPVTVVAATIGAGFVAPVARVGYLAAPVLGLGMLVAVPVASTFAFAPTSAEQGALLGLGAASACALAGLGGVVGGAALYGLQRDAVVRVLLGSGGTDGGWGLVIAAAVGGVAGMALFAPPMTFAVATMLAAE
jgi:hypothetical protein